MTTPFFSNSLGLDTQTLDGVGPHVDASTRRHGRLRHGLRLVAVGGAAMAVSLVRPTSVAELCSDVSFDAAETKCQGHEDYNDYKSRIIREVREDLNRLKVPSEYEKYPAFKLWFERFLGDVELRKLWEYDKCSLFLKPPTPINEDQFGWNFHKAWMLQMMYGDKLLCLPGLTGLHVFFRDDETSKCFQWNKGGVIEMRPFSKGAPSNDYYVFPEIPLGEVSKLTAMYIRMMTGLATSEIRGIEVLRADCPCGCSNGKSEEFFSLQVDSSSDSTTSSRNTKTRWGECFKLYHDGVSTLTTPLDEAKPDEVKPDEAKSGKSTKSEHLVSCALTGKDHKKPRYAMIVEHHLDSSKARKVFGSDDLTSVENVPWNGKKVTVLNFKDDEALKKAPARWSLAGGKSKVVVVSCGGSTSKPSSSSSTTSPSLRASKGEQSTPKFPSSFSTTFRPNRSLLHGSREPSAAVVSSSPVGLTSSPVVSSSPSLQTTLLNISPGSSTSNFNSSTASVQATPQK